MENFEKDINQNTSKKAKGEKGKKDVLKIVAIILVIGILLVAFNISGCQKATVENIYAFENIDLSRYF